LNDRALNRALLARQGLLEPFDGPPVVDVVERIGAMQAQHWPAVPVGLWTRMRSFAPEDLWAALSAGDLLFGITLRGTLHLVSAREHPAYAVVAEAAGIDDWRRTKAPLPEAGAGLRADLLTWAAEPRAVADVAPFAEEWVAAHPGAIDPAEVDEQRRVKWRPLLRCSRLVRVPAGGTWGPKTPALSAAAPGMGDAPAPEAAIDEVVRRHLRAFGPAGVDDIAGWMGLAPAVVRPRVEAMADSLAALTVGRRTLYDLPDAPRPGEDAVAPVRFLGDFDSMLLAYAVKHRGRIWPEALRDHVYVRGNLRIRASVLVDGLVAGVWSDEAKRGEATLTVTLGPGAKLSRAARKDVVAEGERLLAARHPRAKATAVAFAG
jgi:hypothetical protein